MGHVHGGHPQDLSRSARRSRSPTITASSRSLTIRRHRSTFPGYQIVYGQEWERGGVGGHYRAIMDEQGRVQVAICFNMDLGDAWEWADAPEYPEKYSGAGLPRRRQLRALHDDPLSGAADPLTQARHRSRALEPIRAATVER